MATYSIQDVLTDPVARIESFLQIENKQRELVPMILNPIQFDMITTQTGRDIYVKPAQVGGSSGLIADTVMDTIVNPGTVSVIISYEEFITQRLLRKAQNFYDNLLKRIPSIPKMHHSSSYEKTFPDINSSLYIGSARSYVFGRGEAIHNAILDEYAFWDESSVERITGPLLDRVPHPPFGKVKILSTPNGENNFRVLYVNGRDGLAIGKSTFKSHFYPWFIHMEYQIPRGGVCLQGDGGVLSYDAEEMTLIERFGLTENQIRWRRYKIVEMEQLKADGSSRALFKQEFPEDDDSCFLTSGDMYYDSDQLKRLEAMCFPAPTREEGVHIWNEPKSGIQYYLGVDPGLGKVSHSVGQIWHFERDDDGKDKAVHDATLGGLFPSEVMVPKTVDLAKHYHGAKICPESNIDSYIKLLVYGTKPYKNVYKRKDLVSGRLIMAYGWQTNIRTKKFMLEELASMLPRMETHDRNVVSQMRNIRYDDAREQAFSVGADDYHDAAGLAVVCRDGASRKKGFVGTSGYKWN